MPNSFNIKSIPDKAEIYAINQERVVRIIVPPKTKVETGRRAAEEGIRKWVEGLFDKGYELVSDVDIEGPFFCPFLDHYGEDMWLGRGHFTSFRPRFVPSEQMEASRRLAEEAGYDYETWRNADVKAVPTDAGSQLRFVRDNPEKVYRDLQELKDMEIE